MEDIIKSIKAHLYDRVVSPLSGAFIVAWCIWNYRLLVILFSSETIAAKFLYIDQIYSESLLYLSQFWWKGFIFPAFSSLLYIFLYPVLALPVYRYALSRQGKLESEKHKHQEGQLLTHAQSRELRKQLAQLELQYNRELHEASEQNKSLTETINGLEKTLSSLKESQSVTEPNAPDLTYASEASDLTYAPEASDLTYAPEASDLTYASLNDDAAGISDDTLISAAGEVQNNPAARGFSEIMPSSSIAEEPSLETRGSHPDQDSSENIISHSDSSFEESLVNALKPLPRTIQAHIDNIITSLPPNSEFTFAGLFSEDFISELPAEVLHDYEKIFREQVISGTYRNVSVKPDSDRIFQVLHFKDFQGVDEIIKSVMRYLYSKEKPQLASYIAKATSESQFVVSSCLAYLIEKSYVHKLTENRLTNSYALTKIGRMLTEAKGWA